MNVLAKATLAEPSTELPASVLAVVHFAALPVVFWLNVGQVNVPVLKSPDVGVPSNGVTSVGLVESTTEPLPVLVVTPVPPLKTGSAEASVNDAKDAVEPD
jgi:hypothetical protein